MASLGKMLILMGLFLVVAGGLLVSGGKFFGLGRLPGDLFIQKGNFSIYFPVITCIVLSVLLTVLANLFFRRQPEG